MEENDIIDMDTAEESVAYRKWESYSPQEMRELTGISSNAMLKYYNDEFEPFLHTIRTTGRHRRYASMDVPVLIRIRELCQDQKVRVSEAERILEQEGFERVVKLEEAPRTDFTLGTQHTTSNAELLSHFMNLSDSIEEYLASSEKRIRASAREQSKALQKEITELNDTVAQQNEVIRQQTELIKAQQDSEKRMQEQISGLASQLDTISQQTKPKKHFWQKKK